ncbi:MAG: hypothetical protein KC616_18350 [Myxococcales bacterium]|nr:hypothetical protein [Myxococcales bacterium]
MAMGPLQSGAIGIEDVVDGGNDYAWQRVEIPGTVCSDGSQYKFFVYDNPASDDLVLYFEGGGACWDYPSCSGQQGILGAANPNGISDDYITGFAARYVSPIVNGADPGLPLRSKDIIATNGWDVVFMPYCTGDVHVGNNVQTYTDPTGQNPPITFRHAGFVNTQAALAYLAGRFPDIDRLLVSGFSAGGVATAAGYYEARTTLDPAQGFMLNDSGPLFPAPNGSFNSRPLHDTITEAWGLDSVFAALPASFDPNDYGSATDLVAIEFPNDQLAYTGYSSDFNFSRFSYERFYPGLTQSQILAKWRQDQANLIDAMNDHPNWSFHIPWERQINDSHCSSIITFIGSHSCPNIRKKKWYEFWEFPWSQSWKCPGGVAQYGFDRFFDSWILADALVRWVEPYNQFNAQDPGMQIVAPLINDAISGE